jgi:hypothetical protein
MRSLTDLKRLQLIAATVLTFTKLGSETCKTKRVRLFTEFLPRKLAAHAALLSGLSLSHN